MSQTHTVQPGDSLWRIALDNNLTLDDLLGANPQIDNPRVIRPGESINLPRDSFERSSSNSNPYTNLPNSSPGLHHDHPHPPAANSYRVQPGDSLHQIAKRHGVSLRQLMQANPQITNPSLIRPGQSVLIPSNNRADSASSASSASTAPPSVTLSLGNTLLEHGSTGSAVRALQTHLNAAGFSLEVDGVFGNRTKAAVRDFQRSRGLVADGLVGPKTKAALLSGASPTTQPSASAPLSPSSANYPRNPGATGPALEYFPVAGGQFNVGYDGNWDNFNNATARHNSDYSLSPTNASHPNGHLGVDIYGPRGAPIVSPVSGEIVNVRRNTSIGGNTVTVRRGNHYFYHAHLDSVPNGLRPGQTITAGTPIGTLGDSGNARGTAPHLHFSIYRGANGYRSGTVNPFPHLENVLPTSATS